MLFLPISPKIMRSGIKGIIKGFWLLGAELVEALFGVVSRYIGFNWRLAFFMCFVKIGIGRRPG